MAIERTEKFVFNMVIIPIFRIFIPYLDLTCGKPIFKNMTV